MKLLFSLFILTLSSFALAQGPSKLTISVIPQQPILIPYGSATVLGVPVKGPYFVMNSVNVRWDGAGDLEVIAVTVKSHSDSHSSFSISCGISGDQLAAAFAPHTSNGNVFLTPGIAAVSGPLPCEGMNLPSPLPTIFNIPATVQVTGVIVNANGNPVDRITGSQEIVIQ